MKKQEHLFKNFCKDFEKLSGFSFHEDRIQRLSTGDSFVLCYDAVFRGESNIKTFVNIFMHADGKIKWRATCEEALEEIYALHELYFQEGAKGAA
ncbi:hypothetical protein [Paenibacillus campinasensis]|uniref:Uncharacterized protein n=1 Tax=Paenibacillus campinasensis TaxID=66347 RepID=A0A268EI64_9BACL|nr:hypothetical protein [Paenibacillus campinasensis]PAD72828.1 hypothetical protein CHH67_21205 [Paenibacillus campinasensis]